MRHALRPRIVSLLLGSALACGLAACAAAPDGDAEEGEPSEDALEAARAGVEEGLPIFTSESPSGGASFSFCSKPARAVPVHLTNAAWLAMLSANEYAHLGYLAPQLLDLGFGTARDRAWVQCGRDLGHLRDYELTHQQEVTAVTAQGKDALLKFFRAPERVGAFGACAKDFILTKYTGAGPDGPELPGASFRDHLMRESKEASYIQFLSAKPYSFLERWMGRGSSQAVISRHGTKPVVIVTFRGTEPPTRGDVQFREVIDLVKDIEFFKKDLTEVGYSPGWGYAHSGFVSSFQALDDVDAGRALSRRIKALTQDDPNVGIWIAGHSLGGALATLMTARLLDLKEKGEALNVKGLYTFGSPMVGNDTFKKKLEESAARHGVTIARFRNDQDMVTRFPGVVDVLNYHHVGTLAFLSPTTLTFPSTAPPYASWNLDDHSIAGIVGPRSNRTKVTGYYSRILAQLSAQRALSACEAQ